MELKKEHLDKWQRDFNEIKNEIGKVVVGQEKAINGLLRAICCKNHVLLEGIPGVAKTLLIKTLAHTTGCQFKRIQFTPDLLPSDIIGITSYDEKHGFHVIRGPIFSNFILADEINRAPPKVQSALLEAMQEKQATIGKETYTLDEPFFVFATQNPIETLGTYPLPEAQVDRFLFKIEMTYPTRNEERLIIEKNINLKPFEEYGIKKVISAQEIIKLQEATKHIRHTENIKDYIVNIVHATREPETFGIRSGKYIELGVSPRASISLFIAAKAEALLQGKEYVTPQHIKNVAYDVLRHRIILNYAGQAEEIKVGDIITEILSKVPIP